MILDKLMYVHLEQIKNSKLTPLDIPLNPPNSLEDSDTIVCPRPVPGWKMSYQFDVSSSDVEMSFIPPQVELGLEKDVPTFADYSELPHFESDRKGHSGEFEVIPKVEGKGSKEEFKEDPNEFFDKPLFNE